MTAEIQHQLPLKWEDFSVDNDKSGIPDPPPLPPLSYLLGRLHVHVHACTITCI